MAKEPIGKCVSLIETFLKSAGLNPKEHKLKNVENTYMFWRGSAMVLIGINQYDVFNTIIIISPIVKLPEKNLLPFYRKCLEINYNLINCAIYANKDKIGITVERPIDGLDYEELGNMIANVSKQADDLDDILSDEFNAVKCSDDL